MKNEGHTRIKKKDIYTSYFIAATNHQLTCHMTYQMTHQIIKNSFTYTAEILGFIP